MGVKRFRRFWLEDETGERVPLNGERGIWLIEPKGLGLESDEKYAAGGAVGFYQVTSGRQDRQATPQGVLLFRRRAGYMDYNRLTDWILQASELTLVYMPPYQADAFRRRVAVARIDKDEADQTGWLRCPVTFRVLTPWSTSETIRQAVTRSGVEPFRVGVSRVSVDRLSDGLDYAASVTVTPRGRTMALELIQEPGKALRAPCITFAGAVSGRIYGRCQIAGTVPSTATLEYSNVPLGQYVRARVYDADGKIRTETDLLDQVDLQYEPFPELPTAEPVTVTLRTTSERSGDMIVSVRTFRRTV